MEINQKFNHSIVLKHNESLWILSHQNLLKNVQRFIKSIKCQYLDEN